MVTSATTALTSTLPAHSEDASQDGAQRGLGAEFKQEAAAAAKAAAAPAAKRAMAPDLLSVTQRQDQSTAEKSIETRTRHYGGNSKRHRAGKTTDDEGLNSALSTMQANLKANLSAIRVEGISSFMGRGGQSAERSASEQRSSAGSALASVVVEQEPFDPSRYTANKQLTNYERQNLATMYAKGSTPSAGVIARRYGGCAFNTIVGLYLNITL